MFAAFTTSGHFLISVVMSCANSLGVLERERVEAMRRGLDRLVEFSFLSGCGSRTSTQLY